MSAQRVFPTQKVSYVAIVGGSLGRLWVVGAVGFDGTCNAAPISLWLAE